MSKNPLRRLFSRAEHPTPRPEPLCESQMDELRAEVAAFGLLPRSCVDVFRKTDNPKQDDVHVLTLVDYEHVVEAVVTDPELPTGIAGRSAFRIPSAEYFAEYVAVVEAGKAGDHSMPTAEEFGPLLEHLRAVRTGEGYRFALEGGSVKELPR